MRKNIIKTGFAVLLFTILACDFEKLTGYNHDADPVPESAKVFGIMTNKFTGEPIGRATIRVGNQATFSDENGEYLFYYHLGEDDERNKPVAIQVTASRFFPFDTSVVIFPETEIDPKLTYAAPIIRRLALIDSFCQAEVFDYQGKNDVLEVTGTFLYVRPGERVPSLERHLTFAPVLNDSDDVAFFQTIVDTEILGFGNLMQRFKVQARDRQGYTDSTSSDVVGVSSLIFPPF